MAAVPISLPADMLQRLAASPQTPNTSGPAAALTESGEKIVDAYRRYDDLRVLTRLLNGLPQNAPFPEHVQIDEIAISFRVNNVPHTLKTRTTETVSDIYRLLALETDALVRQMHDEAIKAREAAAAIEAAVSRPQSSR